MYQLGKPLKRHHKRFLWAVAAGLVLLAGWPVTAHFLHSDTTIGSPPLAKTTTISADKPKTKVFDEPLFTINLPTDWKTDAATLQANAFYRFYGSPSTGNTRWLDVYIDRLPANFAMNRMLPVQADGNIVSVTGPVSDNCTTFTSPGTPIGSGTALAKWQGITFTCDTGNYNRDVVGIGSGTVDNSVTLTGSTGAHKIYFTYTDNSAAADYSYFTDALKSFVLK